MKQEDKEILLKDLCARSPYNNLIVRVTDMNNHSYQEEGKLLDIRYADIDCNGVPFLFNIENFSVLCDITEIKPYLRPMSSMTEKECYELHYIRSSFTDNWKYIKTPIPLSIANYNQVDWLNSHHFDYRGLIEKGLALEAPDGMYQ